MLLTKIFDGTIPTPCTNGVLSRILNRFRGQNGNLAVASCTL